MSNQNKISRADYLLAQLSEECAETIKEINKALKFGLSSCHPDTGAVNRVLIATEMLEAMTIFSMLQDEEILPKLNSKVIAEKKKNRFLCYYKIAQENGRILENNEQKD